MSKSQLIAAVTFQIFPKHQLIELVFCAVDASLQLQGKGSFIMNVLKQAAIRTGYRTILTYADNEAIRFFHKQGFGLEITIPQAVWAQLKAYERSTLMECPLKPNAAPLKDRAVAAKKYPLRAGGWNRKLKPSEFSFCLCDGPSHGFMLMCNSCKRWYHGTCCGIKATKAQNYKYFYCVFCSRSKIFELRHTPQE